MGALNRVTPSIFTMKPDDHSQSAKQPVESIRDGMAVDENAPDPDEGDLDDLDGEL